MCRLIGRSVCRCAIAPLQFVRRPAAGSPRSHKHTLRTPPLHWPSPSLAALWRPLVAGVVVDELAGRGTWGAGWGSGERHLVAGDEAWRGGDVVSSASHLVVLLEVEADVD